MTKRLLSLTDDLKQISECSLYRDPRVSKRARLHTFCRECRETATINQDSCPLCRPFLRLPEDGYGRILKKSANEKLVDLHQEYLEKKMNLKDEKVIGEFISYIYLQQERLRKDLTLQINNFSPESIPETIFLNMARNARPDIKLSTHNHSHHHQSLTDALHIQHLVNPSLGHQPYTMIPSLAQPIQNNLYTPIFLALSPFHLVS